MNKRDFLAAAGASIVVPAVAQPQAYDGGTRAARPGPALLTLTGAIGKPNRGGFDPVLDQMMAKQKLSFAKGFALDFAAVAALPAIAIRPTLEYDNKRHTLQGPLLLDVLRAAGAPAEGRLILRAIDGYAPSISLADARKYRFIIATHLDGKSMPLGGLGPLWAVYEADRFEDMVAKPVEQRFALCPWGLYHIDVQAG